MLGNDHDHKLRRRQSLSMTTQMVDQETGSRIELLDQFQSSLFGKLPLEIRAQIWGYALSFGGPLHIIPRGRRFERRFRIADCERLWRDWASDGYGHRWLGPPTSDIPHGACYQIYAPVSSLQCIRSASCEDFQPLSLLRTCRRM